MLYKYKTWESKISLIKACVYNVKVCISIYVCVYLEYRYISEFLFNTKHYSHVKNDIRCNIVNSYVFYFYEVISILSLAYRKLRTTRNPCYFL